MEAWTVHIKTKKDGEKILLINVDGNTVDIKDIMSRCIRKYSQVKSFFANAEKKGSFFYSLDDVIVQINNEYYGCIDFTGDEHSGVTEIKIHMTPIYLLNNVFPE